MKKGSIIKFNKEMREHLFENARSHFDEFGFSTGIITEIKDYSLVEVRWFPHGLRYDYHFNSFDMEEPLFHNITHQELNLDESDAFDKDTYNIEDDIRIFLGGRLESIDMKIKKVLFEKHDEYCHCNEIEYGGMDRHGFCRNCEGEVK